MKKKKMSTAPGSYTERFKPSIANYQAGKLTCLATGLFDEKDGIFIEWIEGGLRIVVKIEGKEHKQTIQEFVNNCQ